jgi:cohesin loading factor subunit SCC2
MAMSSTASKELKKVYKLLVPTIPLFTVFMERLHALLTSPKVTLDDQPLLMLTNAATAALEMDCPIATSYHSPTNTTALGVPAPWGPQIQVICLDLITAAFQKSGPNRVAILEDLFGILLKLPSSKRSLRSFTVRYSSALTPNTLARCNAQWVGPLLNKSCPLDMDQPHRIQMITAVFLQILHACVVRPVYEEVEGEESSSKEISLRSGLGQCHTVADYLARALLGRCSRKESAGGSSEFRPIVSNIVDDLLVVLLVPEYPAAEILLVAIVNRINQDLHNAREHKVKLETTYMNLAFDVLGKVLSVQARLRALYQQRRMHMKICDRSEENTSNKSIFNCYCGSSYEDGLIIRCDDCKLCWHGHCVGMDEDRLEEEWFCDYCRLGHIAIREKKKLGSHLDTAVMVDDTFAMRQAFLAMLSHREGVMGLEPSIAFHMARWADELDATHGKKTTATTRVLVNSILECWDTGFSDTHAGETMTEEGGIRVILALLNQSSKLLQEHSFKNQVSFVVELMKDKETSSFRKQAVKAIERMADGDHLLMTFRIIKDAVSNRLQDESISVREAALSLVGSYVVQFPAVTKAYHPSLIKCLSDEGVSVRKRAVNIFLDILTADPAYKARAEVFFILLQRAADKKEEDSVRDLIYGTLMQLWIQNGDALVAPLKKSPSTSPISSTSSNGPLHSPSSMDGDTPGIVTPAFSAAEPSQPLVQRRADIAAQQMIEVVRVGGIGCLETVLKRLLTTSEAESLRGPRGNDHKRDSHVMDAKQCKLLVSALFERLLSIEEEREKLGVRVGVNLAATLNTINVFSEVSPTSVYEKLAVILPYLKADNGVDRTYENAIVAASCEVVARTSSIFERADIERLAASSVAKDLQQIVYKLSGAPVAAAVRAMSALAHHPNASTTDVFSKKLLAMARTFFQYLLKKVNESEDATKQTDKAKGNKQRALSVLGLICQYHARSFDTATDAIDVEDENEESLTSSDQLTWKNISRACFEIFTAYFDKPDPDTKRVALRALGGIFMAEPRLMLELEQEGFLKVVLDPNADGQLQLEAMESWRNILIAEEKRIDGGYAKKLMEQNENITVSKRIAGDQDGDSNIFGGVLTSYADSIYHMTKVKNMRVRYAACELLSVMMRQGLVNPNEAVPHLFALQGDVDHPAIRELACTLLMAEGEKRPDTLRLRIRHGVRLAYEFQHEIRDGGQVSALLPNQKNLVSIFDGVYRECVSKNKKQRHGLFKNLLGLFEIKDLHKKDLKSSKPASNLPLLGFTAEILAYLPYTVATDPLFIIHQIGSLVSLQGEQVIDHLAECLRPVGLASDDIYDDRNASEDDLERAARSKFPSKTSEAASLNDENFDMTNFIRLCQAAVTMSLLLRLKAYLRQIYGLSEARCIAYDPNEKEKVGEKSISKTSTTVRFDASIVPKPDLDNMIKQYATFRVLMREENAFAMSQNKQESDLEDDNDNDDEKDGNNETRKRKI